MGIEAKGTDQSLRNQVLRQQVMDLWLITTFFIVLDIHHPLSALRPLKSSEPTTLPAFHLCYPCPRKPSRLQGLGSQSH